ncbi:hypothetical protein [Lacticaseibacillus absianus]|uniref:hypothetical protein n=1 Tax=Lacticaseibacillus absianus TaxID=2729623 RepID=UPI0015CA389F|nr:hypothetical protein [Lacticaseibacillus absianus]
MKKLGMGMGMEMSGWLISMCLNVPADCEESVTKAAQVMKKTLMSFKCSYLTRRVTSVALCDDHD